MWELHSPFNEPARCVVVCQPSHPFPCLVTVTVGDRRIFCEQLGSETAALEEASYLFDDYLIRGWTELIYCDSRLARALSLDRSDAAGGCKPVAVGRTLGRAVESNKSHHYRCAVR